MPDKAEIDEAFRVAKDLSKQTQDANTRLITGVDPEGRTPPPTRIDESVRDGAHMNENHLVQKYRGAIAKNYSDKGDYSSYDLKSNPDYYGR